jgi:hypothetical protein
MKSSAKENHEMTVSVNGLNTRTIDQHPLIFKQAIEYWEEGNIEGVLAMMSNERRIGFVVDNMHLLSEIGKYEEALLHAYTGIRTNYANWSVDFLGFLFARADSQKLRETGDPIPDQAEFILYRGVSGRGRRRRVNSFSWTESPNIAAWFAKRFCDLPDPAVFAITVSDGSIMACSSDRSEAEYLLRLPLPTKPKRLRELPEAFSPRDNALP